MRRRSRIFKHDSLPLRAVIHTKYGTIQVDLARTLVTKAGIREGDRALGVIDEERKVIGLQIGGWGGKLHIGPTGSARYAAKIRPEYLDLLAGWKGRPSYHEAVIEENDGKKCIMFDYGYLLGSANQEPELVPETPTEVTESTGSPNEAGGSTPTKPEDPSDNYDTPRMDQPTTDEQPEGP